MSVRVRAGSRIHIALADMGFASPRAFGGVGFMLDRIAADVELRRSVASALTGADNLDEPCRVELSALITNLAEANGQPVEAVIRGHAPQHVGLGTKTALKLALISGYHRLAGLPIDRVAQQRSSGRGGASGIGVHGFFEGGVLWDAGKPLDEIPTLLPSGASIALSTPVLMARYLFPKSWVIGLCLPDAKHLHGDDERRFFEANAPTARSDALETMAFLYHGVLPAFQLQDISLLASSLAAIVRTGFKHLEVKRCGATVINLLGDLSASGYAAGMSSMGPLVYVIFPADDARAAADVKAICSGHGAQWLGICGGLNRGADIRWVTTR